MFNQLARFAGRTAAKAFDLLMILVPDNVERWLRTYAQVIPRDVRSLYMLINMMWTIYNYKRTNHVFLENFKEVLKTRRDKVAFIFEDEKWTFRELDDYSNKIAAYFHQSMSKGEVVSIFVTNRPAYVGLWLGLAKIGVVSSLINTNMKDTSLSHCITSTKSKTLIYSKDLEAVVMDSLHLFASDINYYCLDENPVINKAVHLEAVIADNSNFDLELPYSIDFQDHLWYIFTSGTTGLPKPAIVTHAKFLFLFLLANKSVGVQNDDILYNCMPLYHISGCLGVIGVLMVGCTNVIKKKFSAKSYIPDCIKHNVTVGQYIGEMCRYLLKTEVKENERNHKIRVMSGNGLTESVWRKLVARFNIPYIREFYGATEGNTIRVGTENVVGSCGFFPLIIPFSDKLYGCLILVNEETGEPVRNSDGLCIKAPPGIPGMIVGLIPSSKNSLKKFDGYLNKEETEKKIIKNVFKKGDKAFSSGDLLVMDHLGNLFFRERLGDTFRWKGENVSTTEVENTIMNCRGIQDCAVYSVKVDGEEGSAGMCALISDDLNIDEFLKYLYSKLPQYAIPVFVRIVNSFEYTVTFKKIKFKLKQEAFDPNKVTDIMYVRQKRTYVPLNKEIFEVIKSGNFVF